MAASLAIQSAYLSTSSFPVVVLTECDVLSDLDRTQVVEQLEQLIDERERHALVIDLTLGAALPESQRIYIAETLEMRKRTLPTKWAGLAIVVGEPVQSQSSKADAWLQLAPVPAQVFGTLEAATAWAENQLNPRRSTGSLPVIEAARPPTRTRPIMTGMPERTTRTSGAIEISTRTSISEYLKPSEKEGKKPLPAKPKPQGLRAWLTGPRAVGAGVAVLAAVVLLFLAPPPEGELSSAEARSFEALKGNLALHVRRQRNGRGQLIANGETCALTDKLRFEIDVPAKGYIMILSTRPDGSVFATGPSSGQASGGIVGAGASIPLPGMYELEATEGKEAFYLVGCPETFTPSDCKASGTGLTCPAGCGVSEFVVNKKR